MPSPPFAHAPISTKTRLVCSNRLRASSRRNARAASSLPASGSQTPTYACEWHASKGLLNARFGH
eukprot:6187647-Pleurochrysis_carterae.AAC.1